MKQTITVFDMATLTRKDAIILEYFLYHGYQSAIIISAGHYYIATQIDREHGLCISTRDRGIITTYTEPESKHTICMMRNRENPYVVPALYDTGIYYDYSTIEEAKQAIKKYLL